MVIFTPVLIWVTTVTVTTVTGTFSTMKVPRRIYVVIEISIIKFLLPTVKIHFFSIYVYTKMGRRNHVWIYPNYRGHTQRHYNGLEYREFSCVDLSLVSFGHLIPDWGKLWVSLTCSSNITEVNHWTSNKGIGYNVRTNLNKMIKDKIEQIVRLSNYVWYNLTFSLWRWEIPNSHLESGGDLMCYLFLCFVY